MSNRRRVETDEMRHPRRGSRAQILGFSDPVADATRQAVAEVLEALATLAMQTRLYARDIKALVEPAFVRAVDREANRGLPHPDISTVTARTGVHAGLVNLIRANRSRAMSPEDARQPITRRVLRDWQSLRKYTDAHGQPRVLPVRGAISFNGMVKRHGVHIRPRTVLNELIRIKAVRRVRDRHVEMVSRPDLDVERTAHAIRELGDCARECVETLLHRAMHPESPRYYRRVSGLHVENAETPGLIRFAAAQASAWSDDILDAITRHDVTARPGPCSPCATALSVHAFISERPSAVPRAAMNPSVKRTTSRPRQRTR
jgi:hypothetical protein